MFESRVYGLSFRPKKGKVPPAVVVEVSSALQEPLEAYLLKTSAYSIGEQAHERLGSQSYFEHFGDMFEPDRFGYAKCGVRTVGDTSVQYAVELKGPEHVLAVALTIQSLLVCARAAGHTHVPPASNAKQLFDVDFGVGVSRQALGGWFDAAAGQWFARRGAEGPGEPTNHFSPEAFAGHPLQNDYPKQAMMAAWRALATKELRPYAENCVVTVKPTGHFAFICLGCNVAAFHDIAPEMDTGHPGRFTCWNLDNVIQLVTCFAGICALYQVLAEDMG